MTTTTTTTAVHKTNLNSQNLKMSYYTKTFENCVDILFNVKST